MKGTLKQAKTIAEPYRLELMILSVPNVSKKLNTPTCLVDDGQRVKCPPSTTYMTSIKALDIQKRTVLQMLQVSYNQTRRLKYQNKSKKTY